MRPASTKSLNQCNRILKGRKASKNMNYIAEDAANAKVTATRPQPSRVNIRTRNNAILLSPETDLYDFINNTLHAADESNMMNLTKSQIRARQVVSKDLKAFNGDPKYWPAFISRLRETTRSCATTTAKTLERLSRCLKGQALEAVKSDLSNPEALPNLLTTL